MAAGLHRNHQLADIQRAAARGVPLPHPPGERGVTAPREPQKQPRGAGGSQGARVTSPDARGLDEAVGRDLGVPLGASPSLAPGSLPWERPPPWRNPPRGQTPCTTSRRRGRGCRAQKSCKSQARATSITPAPRGHGTERVLGAVGTPVRRTRIKLVSLLAETDLFPHQEQGAGALPVRP